MIVCVAMERGSDIVFNFIVLKMPKSLFGKSCKETIKSKRIISWLLGLASSLITSNMNWKAVVCVWCYAFVSISGVSI